jgi:molecular chaperone GrpE
MPTSPASEQPPDDAAARVSVAEQAADQASEVAELREELARTQDRHRRALADLDNYRKRVEREAVRRAADVRHALLLEWLEAVDSVERALRMEPGDPGLSAVLEQMEAILARHGVTRLDALGTRFDPERHEAIAVAPSADVPNQTVLEVARSGFGTDDGTVLRPAQVVVSRQPAGER